MEAHLVMAKNSSATINWIVGGIAAYFVGSAIAGAVKRRKGIGKVERIKRRIYKEVSLAQDAGVDFSRKYDELTPDMIDALNTLGHDLGWKQSKRAIESGKPYTESYYGSLRRAWNAVSGVQGIGRAYDVKDANGNTVLTWIEAATEHIEQEPEQHVLLALPPHIEEKKKKVPKAKKPSKADEDYAHRFQFAQTVWQQYRKDHPYFDDSMPNAANPAIRAFKHKHAVVADSYARNKMRIKNTRSNGKVVEVIIPELGNDWMRAGSFDDYMVQYAQAILDAESNKYLDSGFDREDLDDIRRALLDKAKHMHVTIPEDYRSQYHDIYLRGDDRYKALEWINWILWTHQHYDVGGDTYYPYCSYETKEEALRKHGGKMQGRGWKIIPVWEVPIEKITGLL